MESEYRKIDNDILKKRRRNRRSKWNKVRQNSLWIPDHKRTIDNYSNYKLRGHYLETRQRLALIYRVCTFTRKIQYMNVNVISHALRSILVHISTQYLSFGEKKKKQFVSGVVCLQPVVNEHFFYYPFNVREKEEDNFRGLIQIMELYSNYCTSMLYFVPELRTISLIFEKY